MITICSNWDFHWSETGASGDSCSQTYYGPEPFSEVEARNVRDWVMARKDRIVFYQTLHSYSQVGRTDTNQTPERANVIANVFKVAQCLIPSYKFPTADPVPLGLHRDPGPWLR